MKSIYACKLYKSSSRKDKIKAAMQDPLNARLMQQVANYLDEEYATPANLGQESAPDSDPASDLDPGLDDDFNPSDNLVTVPSHGGGSSMGGGHLPPKPDMSLRDDDMDLDGDSSSPDSSGSDSPSSDESADDDLLGDLDDEPVEEATYIKSSIAVDTQVLKGSLNSSAETSGVNRIQVKDAEKELWIFYNDDINLNNIMTQVIEYLNASGQTHLQFNRLARSDNAIVFQINEELENIQPAADLESK